jgi:cytochrome c1
MNNQKTFGLLRLLCYALAILTIVFAFQYKSNTAEVEQGCLPVPICGVDDQFESYSESQKKGRKLFKSHCSSCHKLNKLYIGPALGNIQDQLDSTYLYTFIQRESSLSQIKDSSSTFYHEFTYLTKGNIQNILEYTDTSFD